MRRWMRHGHFRSDQDQMDDRRYSDDRGDGCAGDEQRRPAGSDRCDEMLRREQWALPQIARFGLREQPRRV